MHGLSASRAWRGLPLTAICGLLARALLLDSPMFCRHDSLASAARERLVSVSRCLNVGDTSWFSSAASVDNFGLPPFPVKPRRRRMADLWQPTKVFARNNSNDAADRLQEGAWFRVSDSVQLALHRGDITEWFVDGETDAIVNAANPRMLGGGGVDGAIHRKAGPQLFKACKEIPEVSRGTRCPVGEARVTKGFELPVSRVIHTVGPIFDEDEHPAELLDNAYRNSLKAATEEGIKYIAFPAISCGVYGYPVKEAASVALSAVKEASEGLSEVHFVLFEQQTYFGWLEEAEKQFK